MNRINITWKFIKAIIINVLIYIFYYAVIGRDFANQNFITQLYPAFLVAEIIGAFLYFLYVAYYQIPLEVYEKQDGIISRLEKLEPSETDIEVLIPYDLLFGENDTLKIQVINKSDANDIERCFARFEFIGLLSMMGGEMYVYKFPSEYYQKNILWNRKTSEDGTLTISSNGKEVLDLLKVNKNGFDFLFQDGEKYKQEIKPENLFCEYLFNLRIFGKSETHQIKFSEFYIIRFEYHLSRNGNEIKTDSIQEIISAEERLESRLSIRLQKIDNNKKAIKEYKGAEIRIKN